jgi:hypothetical protein
MHLLGFRSPCHSCLGDTGSHPKPASYEALKPMAAASLNIKHVAPIGLKSCGWPLDQAVQATASLMIRTWQLRQTA